MMSPKFGSACSNVSVASSNQPPYGLGVDARSAGRTASPPNPDVSPNPEAPNMSLRSVMPSLRPVGVPGKREVDRPARSEERRVGKEGGTRELAQQARE